LGLKLEEIEFLPEQGVKTAVIRIGETKIEFLESLKPDGPIAKFIEKKGEGLHHLGLEVSNISETLEELKTKGVSLLDKEPRRGAGNANVAFLHPRESKVLLELVEKRKPV
jgi:methylmalonyl-CoA epimerase